MIHFPGIRIGLDSQIGENSRLHDGQRRFRKMRDTSTVVVMPFDDSHTLKNSNSLAKNLSQVHGLDSGQDEHRKPRIHSFKSQRWNQHPERGQ